ncbi:hypothetical protein CNEO_1230028 [Clostridium neonatale]|nr:hypothetical protein CNEO_1230028 [Clostridium neonatale]
MYIIRLSAVFLFKIYSFIDVYNFTLSLYIRFDRNTFNYIDSI